MESASTSQIAWFSQIRFFHKALVPKKGVHTVYVHIYMYVCMYVCMYVYICICLL
jgi:hypothetical protein